MTDNMTQDRLKEVANTINQELEKDGNHDKNKRDRKHRQQEQQKSGYSFNDGNGNGKGGLKQKSEKEEKKRLEYVQKYSNDRMFAEAVIIEGKSCFAVVSTEDGRITLEEEIPLNDSKNTVLRAPDLSSYINSKGK